MFKAPENEGSGFEKPEPGLYPAICVGLFDRGSIFDERSKKYKRKMTTIFLLLAKNADGENFEQFDNKTFSMFSGSFLRKNIESWRGEKFTDEEAAEFDLSKLIGQPAYLNIIHKDGWANIETIVPLPKELRKKVKKLKFDPLILSLDNDGFDQETFNRLPNKIQEKIMQSPEYKELDNPGVSAQSGDNSDDDFEDDIPFK